MSEKEKFSSIESQTSEQVQKSALRQYAEASGASEEVVHKLESFAASIELPDDIESAAEELIVKLSEAGFHYNVGNFRLQDVFEQKSGSCLGLTLLVGALLIEKGFDPQFEILRGATEVAKQDELVFDEIKESIMSINEPDLPEQHDPYATAAFSDTEHPVLDIRGRRLETTRLVREGGPGKMRDEIWHDMGAEAVVNLSFQELLGTITIEGVREQLSNITNLDEYHKATALLEAGLRVWPENREVYWLLMDLAAQFLDEQTYQYAKRKYKSFDDGESMDHVFDYHLHQLADDETELLERSLAANPTFLEAWYEANVEQMLKRGEKEEAQANFKIAAWCVANSAYLSLPGFYISNAPDLVKLFGEDVAVTVLKRSVSAKKQSFDLNIALYQVTRNPDYLEKIKKQASSLIPGERLKYLYYSKNHFPDLRVEFEAMLAAQGRSEITEQLLKEYQGRLE